MSSSRTYQSLDKLVTRLRDDLNDSDLVLLYAYNRTGKTRLSMAFKDAGKRRSRKNPTATPDTLYFNAFTEDLFTWENDLEGDSVRRLRLNEESSFFNAMTELAISPAMPISNSTSPTRRFPQRAGLSPSRTM
jgi:hypothetical protein